MKKINKNLLFTLGLISIAPVATLVISCGAEKTPKIPGTPGTDGTPGADGPDETPTLPPTETPITNPPTETPETPETPIEIPPVIPPTETPETPETPIVNPPVIPPTETPGVIDKNTPEYQSTGVYRDPGVSINSLSRYKNAAEIGLIQSEPLLVNAMNNSFSYDVKTWDIMIASMTSALPANDEDIRSEDANTYNVPDNIKRLIRIMDYKRFNYLFPIRRDVYTYRAFLEAALKYPTFAGEKNNDSPVIKNMSLDDVARLELSSMFAHFSQEVGANSVAGPIPADQINGNTNQGTISSGVTQFPSEKWRQGLYYTEEVAFIGATDSIYMKDDSWVHIPFPRGGAAGRAVSYHGRGPKQLSWNYNYGPFSREMFGDDTLLEFPERLKSEGRLAFGSAFWFYMTPRNPKPSIHETVVGHWNQTPLDTQQDRNIGFGIQTQIINGGIECGKAERVPQANNRGKYFEDISEYFGVDYWWKDNSYSNYCDDSAAFPGIQTIGVNPNPGSLNYYKSFWSWPGWAAPGSASYKPQLVTYEGSAFSPFVPGDYELLTNSPDHAQMFY